MLTKKDLEQIDNLIKKGFIDFYDSIFEPFATRNEHHHEEIVSEIKKVKKEVSILQDETYEIKTLIKDHEKRIVKLETINNLT